MKAKIAGHSFHLTKFVPLLFIIFLQSYALASDLQIEGDDFKNNLTGRWEGKWTWIGQEGKQHLKIIKIEGNKVHLTGLQEHVNFPDTDEVNGQIENSILLLSWPAAAGGSGCIEEYRMIKDDSNNLILDGHWQSGELKGKVQLKKIE